MIDRSSNRRKEKNINARVMVLEHDMSSEYVLQMYEVSMKFH